MSIHPTPFIKEILSPLRTLEEVQDLTRISQLDEKIVSLIKKYLKDPTVLVLPSEQYGSYGCLNSYQRNRKFNYYIMGGLGLTVSATGIASALHIKDSVFLSILPVVLLAALIVSISTNRKIYSDDAHALADYIENLRLPYINTTVKEYTHQYCFNSLTEQELIDFIEDLKPLASAVLKVYKKSLNFNRPNNLNLRYLRGCDLSDSASPGVKCHRLVKDLQLIAYMYLELQNLSGVTTWPKSPDLSPYLIDTFD